VRVLDLAVLMSEKIEYVCVSVCVCVHLSGFVRAVTSLLNEGFSNDYAQLFTVMR
jgi:hypothetical protein